MRHDMLRGARQAAAELGPSEWMIWMPVWRARTPNAIRAAQVVDPARANAMTTRDTTILLAAVWNDQPGPPPRARWFDERRPSS